jgi:hypothetical protein
MGEHHTNTSGGNYRFWSLALPSWATPPAADKRGSSRRIRWLATRRMGSNGRSAVRAK